jgi:hypothetical protein
MSAFCGQNCHDIFEIANLFENGDITKDKAIERLKGYDLSMRKNYKGSLKETLNKALGVMAEDKKEDRVEEKKVEKVEEKKVEEKVEPKKTFTTANVGKTFDNKFKANYNKKN